MYLLIFIWLIPEWWLFATRVLQIEINKNEMLVFVSWFYEDKGFAYIRRWLKLFSRIICIIKLLIIGAQIAIESQYYSQMLETCRPLSTASWSCKLGSKLKTEGVCLLIGNCFSQRSRHNDNEYNSIVSKCQHLKTQIQHFHQNYIQKNFFLSYNYE